MICRSNKYHASKVVCEGITFDSKKEASRWKELRILEVTGQIEELERQVEYELVPKTGRERAVKYRADFRYKEKGKTVVEDTKGFKTKDYVIKRKLFKWRNPEIEFREV